MGATAARTIALLSVILACVPPATPMAEAPGAAPAAHRVFVSQAGSASVAVIDPERGVIEARIAVGALPHRLLVDEPARAIYVVLVGSQALAEIDVDTFAVRRTFLTAPVPAARADGSAIAAHAARDAAAHGSCFDCHDNRATGAQPAVVGTRPFGVLLTPDRRQLLVTHLTSGEISVIDREGGALVKRVPLPPAGAAREAVDLAQVGAHLYVALRPGQPTQIPGVIRRLDAASFAPLGEAATSADPVQLLALPARGEVLVSNFDSNTVTAFADADALAARYTVTPGPLGLAALDASRVLSLNYYSNAVSIITLGGAVQTFALTLAGRSYANPTHAALAPGGQVAYVVSSGSAGHLLVVDLARQQVTRAIAIDGLSFDVAVVPLGPTETRAKRE